MSIKILDVNDNAPTFTHPPITVELLENTPIGSLVTRVSANDKDLGRNGLIKYSIIGADGSNDMIGRTNGYINYNTNNINNNNYYNYNNNNNYNTNNVDNRNYNTNNVDNRNYNKPLPWRKFYVNQTSGSIFVAGYHFTTTSTYFIFRFFVFLFLFCFVFFAY